MTAPTVRPTLSDELAALIGKHARTSKRGRPRPFSAFDVAGSPELQAAAHYYVRAYSGPSAYLCDLRRRVLAGFHLTNAQLRGALNWARLEMEKTP